MMNKPIRLGFIGGGVNSAVGSSHFIAARMDSLFQIAAGCFSRNEEVNMLTAEKWRIPQNHVYSNWNELIAKEKPNIDALVILTPTPEHYDSVVAAVNAGFPVICEKAMAVSSKEAKSIEDAVNKAKGFLAVTFNYTGYPMIRELRQMIRQGQLGRITQVHIEMPQEGFARLDSNGNPMVPQNWRLTDGLIPTISLDLGVHVVHMVDFLTGEKPIELVATQTTLGRFHQVVDNTKAMVRYTNDMESTFWFSKGALGHRNGFRLRVYGEKASAEWFQMNPEVIAFNDNCGRQTLIDRANVDVHLAQQNRYNRFKSGHPAGFHEAFANLYADIAQQLEEQGNKTQTPNDYVFSARQAREGLEVLEAIALSSNERCWVKINLEA